MIINGTDDADSLRGGGENDRINAKDGNDRLNGEGGKDTLNGNNGNDTINGRNGNDRITGGDGNDSLIGGNGRDLFIFDAIDEVIHMGGEKYQIRHGSEVDIIQDFDPTDQGDLIKYRKTPTSGFSNWEIGSLGWNSNGGTGGDGNGSQARSLDFYQTASLFNEEGIPALTSQKKYQLSTVDSPKLIYETSTGNISPGEGPPDEGNHTAIFEITPTSPFKFVSELAYSFHSTVGQQTVEIEKNASAGFTQVTIVSLDDDTPDYTKRGKTVSESIAGTVMDDAIFGFGGNDTLLGLNGSDNIYGGSGSDRLEGASGKDSLYGNSGNDLIIGGIGNDLINGGEGNDTLRGSEGDDTILGWTGKDLITGDTGNDFLNGEYGNDTVRGGSGDDTLTGSFGSNTLHGGQGIDWVKEEGTDFILSNDQLKSLSGRSKLISIESAELDGLQSDDRIDASLFSRGAVELKGSGGHDTLLGGEKNDKLWGGNNNDILRGNNGNDRLSGGAGDDTIHGGLGVDTIIVRYVDEEIVLTDTCLSGEGTDKLSSIEQANIMGSWNQDIDATAFSGRTTLTGGAGDNLILGGSGHDLLIGDRFFDGDDTLNGGAGDDQLIGGRGNDSLVGSFGFDSLNGTNYDRAGVGERDTLNGGGSANNTRFILGEANLFGFSPKTFYSDSNDDFAEILNFDIKNFESESNFDTIQLAGKASDYTLLKLATETQIRLGSSLAGSILIAKVKNIGNATLNLNNSDHFTFVNSPIVIGPLTIESRTGEIL